MVVTSTQLSLLVIICDKISLVCSQAPAKVWLLAVEKTGESLLSFLILT